MVNVIPSYASIEEMGLHIALEAEQDFNTMMQESGIAELRSIEEEAVVLEAGKKNGIIEKFKGWLEKIWNWIKSLYDKVLEFVKKQIDKVKGFLSKIASKSKESLGKRAAQLKDKDKEGKKKIFGTAHTWDGFNDVINGRGVVWQAVNAYDNFESKLPGFVDKNDKAHTSGAAFVNSAGRSKLIAESEALDKKVKGILGVASLSSENIQKKVKSIIAGKEIKADKDYITSNWSDIFDYGTDFGKTTSDVKKNLNEVKKRFDNSRKELESFQRKFGEEGSDVQKVVSAMKKSKITLTAICNATVANVKARCSEASMFVLRVATATKNKEESTNSTNESAVVPESFQTELASLFDF